MTVTPVTPEDVEQGYCPDKETLFSEINAALQRGVRTFPLDQATFTGAYIPSSMISDVSDFYRGHWKLHRTQVRSASLLKFKGEPRKSERKSLVAPRRAHDTRGDSRVDVLLFAADR